MRTPANIAKHPIHPMLVTLPIGLWVFSLACDLIRLLGGTSPNWAAAASYAIVGGIAGALIAAIPGIIDLLSLPRALQRVGLTHMIINLAVVALYIVNAWLRGRHDPTFPIWLSVIGVVAIFVSGWLGGKLVHIHGVAVETPPEPAA